MEAHPATAASLPGQGGRGRVRLPGLGVGLGTGTVVLYLSIIVLLPLAAVVSEAFSGGWSTFWDQVTSPLAKKSLELTVICSLIVVVLNAIFGTILAWILVRDEFPGKSLVNAVIDLPVRAADDRRQPDAASRSTATTARSGSTSSAPAPRSSSR